MANDLRLRANGVAGALSAGLGTGDTSMSSGGLADLDAVTSTHHAAITLFTTDSDGRVTKKEIVYVTAHTASATTATISRAQEGTSAQTWSTGDKWVHGPTAEDVRVGSVFIFDHAPPTTATTGWTSSHSGTWSSNGTSFSTTGGAGAFSMVRYTNTEISTPSGFVIQGQVYVPSTLTSGKRRGIIAAVSGNYYVRFAANGTASAEIEGRYNIANSYTWPTDQFVTMRIVVMGSSVTAYANGTRVVGGADNFTTQSGALYAGFFTYDTSATDAFQSMKVWSLGCLPA